jgi:hypothetical protein
MQVFRRHLAQLTVGWLLVQAAGFSAAPLTICKACISPDDVPACCRSLQPGQACPMHGPVAGTCHLEASCPQRDVVLLSLVASMGGPPVEGPALVGSPTSEGVDPAPNGIEHLLSRVPTPPPRA